MTLTEFFTGQGLGIQKDLRASMRNANRNASGKTADSIQFEVLETRDNVLFQVTADKHIRNLQDGRGPTKNDGPGTVKNRIKQWIKDKGLVSELSEASLVYLITRKIHREGYKGTPGLIDDIINDSLIDFFEEQIAEIAGNEFVNEIKV